MKIEEKKKIFYRFIKRLFIVVFVAFTALYMSQATGYYEYEMHNKVVLTEDKIKTFEEDVKNGKKIDIDNYVDSKLPSYQNNVSNIGLTLSKGISTIVKNGVNKIFNYLNKMVEE